MFLSTTVDITGPTFTCPGSITETVGINDAGAFITWVEPFAFDPSGVQSFVSSRQSGSFFDAGQTVTVTYTGVDMRGNVATCEFTVSVIAGIIPNLASA